MIKKSTLNLDSEKLSNCIIIYCNSISYFSDEISFEENANYIQSTLKNRRIYKFVIIEY